MQTFEQYLSPSPRLGEIEVMDTVQLMGRTSLALFGQLEDIYRCVDGESSALTIAVFGSPARQEMLPYSDVDVLIASDGTPEGRDAEEAAKELICQLPYDKVDIPRSAIISNGDFQDYAQVNSPDAHVAKSLIVASPADSYIAHEMLLARKTLDAPKLQLEGLVFDHYFIKYRAMQKSGDGYANLKYSEGGSRDIIYLDWAADYITGSMVSERARSTQQPQIEVAVPIVLDYLGWSAPEDELCRAIDIVNMIKHQALELKHQGAYFDGRMSKQTAEELSAHYDYGVLDLAPSDLIAIHSSARGVLSSVKDALHARFMDQVREEATSDETCDYLMTIDDLWNGNPLTDRTEAVEKLLARGRWVDLGTVISQDDAQPEHIDCIVDVALENAAYSHALRNAIRHPNTSIRTLRKMLDSNRLATDDDVHDRYKRMLMDRLAETDE